MNVEAQTKDNHTWIDWQIALLTTCTTFIVTSIFIAIVIYCYKKHRYNLNHVWFIWLLPRQFYMKIFFNILCFYRSPPREAKEIYIREQSNISVVSDGVINFTEQPSPMPPIQHLLLKKELSNHGQSDKQDRISSGYIRSAWK